MEEWIRDINNAIPSPSVNNNNSNNGFPLSPQMLTSPHLFSARPNNDGALFNTEDLVLSFTTSGNWSTSLPCIQSLLRFDILLLHRPVSFRLLSPSNLIYLSILFACPYQSIDELVYKTSCEIITPMDPLPGVLELTSTHMYFVSVSNQTVSRNPILQNLIQQTKAWVDIHRK